jgi:hypothetical protein
MTRRRAIFFSLILALALLGPGRASAAALTVCPSGPPDCQYATIAGALAAAVSETRS